MLSFTQPILIKIHVLYPWLQACRPHTCRALHSLASPEDFPLAGTSHRVIAETRQTRGDPASNARLVKSTSGRTDGPKLVGGSFAFEPALPAVERTTDSAAREEAFEALEPSGPRLGAHAGDRFPARQLELPRFAVALGNQGAARGRLRIGRVFEE